MTTATATFKMWAVFQTSNKAPQQWEATCIFDSKEAAQAFVATLPKGLSAKAHACHTADGSLKGIVTVQATLVSSGVNKGVNEAGIKRYRLARKLFNFEWIATFKNAYRTQEAFEQAISA